MTQPAHLSFTLEQAKPAPDTALKFEPFAPDLTPPAEAGRPHPPSLPAPTAATDHPRRAHRWSPYLLAAAALTLIALAGLLGYEWVLLGADDARHPDSPRAASPKPPGIEARIQAITGRSPRP